MSKQRIVAEMTFVVDASGTTQTFYAATSGWTTRPTDTPANTPIAPRIKSAGSYKRELFSGTRVTGAVRPSFGEIVLYNPDGALDAWMDYGVSGGKVIVRIGDEDGAYPADYTTVYIAYAQYLVADFGEVRVRLRDRLYLLEQPLVTASFAGTGGLEGSSDVKGKLKQWVSSDPGYFPPILIDASLQLYFVQATGPGGLMSNFKVFEGGIPITRGTNYTSASECTTTSPASGEVRFWFGVGNAGPVYFRLGSVPVGDLRVYGLGYKASGATWRFTDIAAQAGITGAGGGLTVGAVLVDDSRTMLDVLTTSVLAVFGWFGMTRLDVFTSGVFNVPATATIEFNQHNASGWTRTVPNEMYAPVWRVSVAVGKTWPCAVLAGATAQNTDYLTRDPWWASYTQEDAAIKTANPGAESAEIEIENRDLQSSLAMTNFISKYLARFGVRRQFFLFTVPMTPENLAIELHDTVLIRLPRFGLSGGKAMRVITQQIDIDKRTITYGVWG